MTAARIGDLLEFPPNGEDFGHHTAVCLTAPDVDGDHEWLCTWCAEGPPVEMVGSINTYPVADGAVVLGRRPELALAGRVLIAKRDARIDATRTRADRETAAIRRALARQGVA